MKFGTGRAARTDRTYGLQWKHRIFAAEYGEYDVVSPTQVIPVGEQDMPELRVLVQPMFQQHYIYYMAHRQIHQLSLPGEEVDTMQILRSFSERYSNPNSSELNLLAKFYPEVDADRLETMTLADCAVRLLVDCKTWQRPTDSQHFSKACSIARRPMKPSSVASSSTDRRPTICN